MRRAGDLGLRGGRGCGITEGMDAVRTGEGLGETGRKEGSWGRDVVRWVEAYDPEGRGLARWRNREEALFPEDWEEGWVTVDAMVLMSRELHAVMDAGYGGADGEGLDFAEGCLRDLDDWLAESFWDPERERMMRWDEEGEEELEEDESPAGFFALAWPGAEAGLTEALRPRCLASVKLGAEGGWTVRGWLKFFEVLLADGVHRQIWSEMARRGLPGEATEAQRAEWERLKDEAWMRREEAPGWVRKVEAGGGRALGALAGVAVAALLGAGAVCWGAGVAGRGAAEAQAAEREAEAALVEGAWGRAAARWGALAKRGGADGDYYRYREAGALMRGGRWEEGLAACEELLERHPEAPNVRMNRGLCLLRLGRRKEAVEAYRALAEDARGAEEWPSVAVRARRALGLLGEKKADGGEWFDGWAGMR